MSAIEREVHQINLARSASFDANNTYPSLFSLLGYRKSIAERLLREHNPEDYKILYEQYEYINSQIKTLLGLT